jgi:hypothetical protein
MGGMTQSSFNSTTQGPYSQQMAANGVRATNGSSPTMGQMQQGIGGLLTNDTQQGGFNDFMGGLMGNFAPAFNSMIGSGFEALGMEPPTQQFIPEPQPEQTPINVQPPKDPVVQDNGWGNVKNDYDAINWSLRQGHITREEADWLTRWQRESSANGDSNWVDGSTRNWDYMNSGLTDRNKGIVDKFYKSVSGNWGESPAAAPAAAPAQEAGGIKGLLMTDRVKDAIENAQKVAGLFG